VFRVRVGVIAALFVLLYGALLARLAYLQLAQGPALRRQGEKRIHRLEQIPPRRGSILDRDGRVLAEDAPVCNLYLVPGQWVSDNGRRRQELVLGEVTVGAVRQILSAGGTQREQERRLALNYLREQLPLTRALAEMTGRSPSTVAKALLHAAERAAADEAPGALHTPRMLLRDVDTDVYLRILRDRNLFGEQSQFAAVEPRLGWRREYPYGDAAAHITGYVGQLTAAEYAQLRGAWGPHGPRPGEGSIPGFFVPTEKERELMQLYELTRDGRTIRAAGHLANDLVGRSGVEQTYNNMLRGAHGQRLLRLTRTSAHGPRVLRTVDTAAEVQTGRDVAVTLSASVQRRVYEILVEETELMRRAEGRPFNAACVLMQPDTGAIEAMVSLPTFHPEEVGERYQEYVHPRSRSPFLNRAISENYPPGSTFKPVVALAALAAGAITPETEFNCQGVIRYAGHDYICMRRHAHGRIKVHEALRVSCNVFFYNTARVLGARKLHAFATDIGFATRTGIDLPNEAAGSLPIGSGTGRGWGLGSTFHFGIGQGIAVTPIQMAVAVSAIANGGAVVRPHLLADERLDRPRRRLNLSEQALQVVRDGMKAVVNDNGTGRRAAFDTLTVAGKSGTADWKQDARTHAWFVAYAPVEDPQIVVVLIIPEGGLGGSTCAPIVKRILAEYFDIHETEGGVG